MSILLLLRTLGAHRGVNQLRIISEFFQKKFEIAIEIKHC